MTVFRKSCRIVLWQKRDELKAEELQKREFINSERQKTISRLRQYKLVRTAFCISIS